MAIHRKDVSFTLSGVVLGAMLVLAATRMPTTEAAGPAGPAGASPSANAAPAASPVDYIGEVKLDPFGGEAGTPVTIRGSGFEAGSGLAIVWNSVVGAWKLEGAANEEFKGRAFEPVRDPVASAVVASDGSFVASFEAPTDFGFSHEVTVERDGVLLNKAAFRLEPRVSISPRAGPPGTRITVTMEGVGWGNLENSWLVTYDNKFTGLLSSVTTSGTAEAVIPATGEIGRHRIRIVHGSFTVPYLNMEQSPRPDRPTFDLDFEVTAGPPIMPPTADAQALPAHAASIPSGQGPAIWTDLATGIVGAPITIFGRGFEAGTDILVTWSTVIGNRVGGNGWDESTSDAFDADVGPDGTFEHAWAIPDDLGGPHRLAATIGGSPVAETSITITPSLVSAVVGSTAQGDEVLIHLKGVGWTETANIYNLVYDNGFLGYVCGFNSQGDVKIHLPASGTPGWHFIDLYPGIYKGEDAPGVQNFRIPQLTAVDDHPGERLPIFHLAFEVTG